MKYYEIEGAVFRQDTGPLEVYRDARGDKPGYWEKYSGDAHRVKMGSNELSLAEVGPYMGVKPAKAAA